MLVSQRGFTLLEVLIAVVILSIGLLGLAGLQSAGLRSTHSADLLAQSSILAADLADRVRANPEGVNFYPAGGGGSCTSGCSSQDMANTDKEIWNNAISSLLPLGNGSVAANADGTLTISISWSEPLGTVSYAMRFRP